MKRGFTLVEVMAVIIIISLLSLLVLPNVINQLSNKKDDIDKTTKQLIINAAELYADENNIDYGTLTLEDLVKSGKLDSPVKNYKTGKEIALNKTIIIVKGNACISGDDGCVEVAKQYKCRRATTLHTETCNSESETGCLASGYTSGSTITYGSLGTKGTLASGDAFDCDVNGDGTYNSTNERFYYVSGLNGSDSSNTAVLIYYNNVSGGVANNTTAYAYDTSNQNWHGPVTSRAQLPTTSQWSNVRLNNTTRAITNEQGGPTTNGGTLPTNFSYAGYAARLLTVQEVNKACRITVGSFTRGELDSCKYLMENTAYANSSLKTGYWLETADRILTYSGYCIHTKYRFANTAGVNVIYYGIRPAIEVKKADIDY